MFRSKVKESMLEKEYFYKEDRKLIDQLQEKAKTQADQSERSTHLNKCAYCGTGMDKLEVDKVPVLYCHSCESIHVGLSDLDNLVGRHKLKHAVGELLLIKTKTSKSA